MKKYKFNTIQQIIEDIKVGKFIIVVDDENRENEGDLVIAAEKITSERINFMAKHGRGLICVPMTEKRLSELKIDAMEFCDLTSKCKIFVNSFENSSIVFYLS